MFLVNPRVAHAGFLFVEPVCNIFYAGEIGLGTFLLQKNWLYNNKIQVYFKYIEQPFFVCLDLVEGFFDDFFLDKMDSINQKN